MSCSDVSYLLVVATPYVSRDLKLWLPRGNTSASATAVKSFFPFNSQIVVSPLHRSNLITRVHQY